MSLSFLFDEFSLQVSYPFVVRNHTADVLKGTLCKLAGLFVQYDLSWTMVNENKINWKTETDEDKRQLELVRMCFGAA
jgi:hypothetical protein